MDIVVCFECCVFGVVLLVLGVVVGLVFFLREKSILNIICLIKNFKLMNIFGCLGRCVDLIILKVVVLILNRYMGRRCLIENVFFEIRCLGSVLFFVGVLVVWLSFGVCRRCVLWCFLFVL